MADDIDDLLDEVETKYIKQKSNDPKRPKPAFSNKLDGDINELLSDTQLDEKGLISTTPTRETNPNTTSTSKQKCHQVYLGGSDQVKGHGTAISQRTCDRLRCTACDFWVCLFDNYKWISDTSYLFLRNNVPDFAKLKSKLSPSKGHRAYCCQCSWRTVKDLTLLCDPDLKWHCGRH